MKTPYLIQRAKFQDRDKNGIDGLLSFDYMGSAEFEFGALPKSLERIRNNDVQYNLCELTFENGKTVNVFCKQKDFTDMPDILENLVKNCYHLKEYCDLDYFVNGVDGHNDFWWDIQNDYMFWKKNEKFTEKFIKALKNK